MGSYTVTLIPGDGIGPEITGKNIANPTAMIQSLLLILRHLGENNAADRIYSAVVDVYNEAKHLTGDVDGTANTTEFAEAVIRKIEEPVLAGV